MFFWNPLAFLMIQRMLTIWSLVPLPFLNLAWTSGSYQFTYCWHGLESFEHYFASMWDECNCVVVRTFFGIAFLWDWNENWPFLVLWVHCWVFQICWHIECSTLTAPFLTWNSSAGISSPPLALLDLQRLHILLCFFLLSLFNFTICLCLEKKWCIEVPYCKFITLLWPEL